MDSTEKDMVVDGGFSLSREIAAILALHPSAPAIEYEDRWYSWGDLAGVIGNLHRCFHELGAGRDVRIGVLLRNRPPSMAALLAMVVGEYCLVTLNPMMSGDRLLQDLGRLSLAVIVGEPEDLDRPGVLDKIHEIGAVAVEVAADLSGVRPVSPRRKARSSEEFRSAPGVALEMLTSGTTGVPKRIPLLRKAFEEGFAGAAFYESDRAQDGQPKLRTGAQLLTNPLSHIGGIYMAINSLLGGRQLCMLEKFTVTEWRNAVVRHRPKVTSLPPAALRMILDAGLPKEDLASLVAIRTGTAPLDPQIPDDFMRLYDLPVLQNYGATEYGGAVAGWTLREFVQMWSSKRGSTGRLHANVEGRTVSPDTGEPLPPSVEGLLELRGPQLGDARAWLRTTDRAVIDADGFLFIKGRADNAINRGGFKIHPDNVARIIEAHPAIREAVVVGIDDRRLGQVPVAAVIAKASSAVPSEAELVAFLKPQLLPYEMPTRFCFVDDVPRTTSMKPATTEVRKLFN